MKSKASLTLMEQLIMLLVFALAAAVCLRAFVWADTHSAQIETTDKAVLLAQSTAETIKGSGGDVQNALKSAADMLGAKYDGKALQINYDNSWNRTNKNPVYRLTAEGVDSGLDNLCKIGVYVCEAESSKIIFTLETAWQMEVSPRE